MRWLRRLRCWLRGHDRIAGICVLCWRGPQGERLRPISGGQFDPTAFADFASETVSSEAMGGAAEASQFGGAPATGGGGGMGIDYSPGFTKDVADAPSGLSKFLSGLGVGTEKGQTSPLTALTQTLGLGATGLGIANEFNVAGQLGQQTKQIQAGQKQATAAAAPAVAFGTETLNRAAGGNLTPALQAQIDEWTQKAKADMASRFASMGLGNSEQLQSAYDQIDEQAMAMKGSMLQQQEETGLAGLQTGVTAGTSVMGVSQQQQQQLAQLIQSANQALGQMAGRQA